MNEKKAKIRINVSMDKIKFKVRGHALGMLMAIPHILDRTDKMMEIDGFDEETRKILMNLAWRAGMGEYRWIK